MKLHPKAIFLGLITDLVLSFVVGPLELWVIGVPPNSLYLFHWSLFLGLLGTAIGGYVTAKQSKSSKLFNAAIFGAIEVFLSLVAAIYLPLPLWFNLTSCILIIPASLIGAYAALPRREN